MSVGQAPGGWYADPLGRFDFRYWDGVAWTEYVSRRGIQSDDHIPGTTDRMQYRYESTRHPAASPPPDLALRFGALSERVFKPPHLGAVSDRICAEIGRACEQISGWTYRVSRLAVATGLTRRQVRVLLIEARARQLLDPSARGSTGRVTFRGAALLARPEDDPSSGDR